MYRSDAKRYSDHSHGDSRLDVLIEAEQVRGIICVLQGHQPRIGRFAVRGLDPVDSLISLVVDIDLARGKGLHRLPEPSHPADVLVILPRVAPYPHDQHVIRRIAVGVCRLLPPAAGDLAAEMLNHHMAVGRRNGCEGVQQGGQRLLTQALEIARLPVVAQAGRIEGFHDALQPAIGHGAKQVLQRRAKRSQWLQEAFPFLQGAAEPHDGHDGRRAIGQGGQDNRGAQLVGSGPGEVAIQAQELLRLVHGIDEHPPQQWTDGMELVFKSSRDAEIAAAAAHSPEEVGVLRRTHPPQLAISGHQVDRQQIVASQAEFGD